MKTYKFLAVALVATGFFSACTNEEVVQPVNVNAPAEISFRLQGGTPETRTLATTLDKLEAFVVYGTDNIVSSPGLLLDGVTVARQLDGTFIYTPKAYYSVGATSAGFFAFSPVSANVTTPITTTSLLTTGASLSYEVIEPDITGNATQEDLLVAWTSVPTSSLTSPVQLTFKHALSRIFVTAKNASDDPVIIKNLTLLNLAKEGSLSVNTSSALTWTPTTSLGSYEYILAQSGVVVPAKTNTEKLVTSMEQGMMVLPQVTVNTSKDYTSDDFALKVTYDFANRTNQDQYIYIANGYEFKAGNQYKISITFDGLNPIEFEVVAIDNFIDDPTVITYP